MDANTWVSEKTSHLDAERLKGEVNSFQEKVKKLQKHQAFMAELHAHEGMMREITQKGEGRGVGYGRSQQKGEGGWGECVGVV